MSNTYTVRFVVVPADWRPGQAEAYQCEQRATGFRWWKEGDPDPPFVVEETRELPPPPPPVDPPQEPEPPPTPTFEVMAARKRAREEAILRCMSDGFDWLVESGKSKTEAFLIGQEFGARHNVVSMAYTNFAKTGELIQAWTESEDEWLDLVPAGQSFTIRERFISTVIGAVT